MPFSGHLTRYPSVFFGFVENSWFFLLPFCKNFDPKLSLSFTVGFVTSVYSTRHFATITGSSIRCLYSFIQGRVLLLFNKKDKIDMESTFFHEVQSTSFRYVITFLLIIGIKWF